ncbi:MAG TPA: FAD-dependent oxidoreductase [Solirubrobacteraceae bacterium]|jgi:glycine cleavage system aminomethyltransferase T/glycine/D-amino acid oxidase-like deaminating enzyme|nr:FAD-dependent oxidoreductase [Solirubrobacteraceae bacterium]
MVRPRELPERARVVIIGGGVGGASIAYHLAQLGERDLVLLDRNELTSGSTFHSAGLVGQLRSSLPLTRMMMDSVELYRHLDCGWVECGGIRLACTPEREEEVLRQVAWARTFGLPLELISAGQAQELFPLMDTAGVRCGSYLATDGYLDPSLLTTALAEGARAGGAQIYTHARVTAIDLEETRRGERRVRGVQTEWGPIEAEVVVNAGGMFAAEIGRMAAVRVPIVPFAHEYLVTQPFRDRTPAGPSGEIVHLPTLRDPDLLVYFREEGGGLVMGGYERHSAPWALDARGLDAIPPDFNGRLLEEDWPRFEEIAVNSRRRVPVMDEITVTRLINGPEAFTPDNEFCLGESEVRGFFVAAGFCAHGLAGAGGIGSAMAQWILAGEPAGDMWEMDIRRFGAQYRSPSYTLKRTREVYETYYDIRYPGHERLAGRPLRTSSAYPWHVEHDAAFGEKSGWERVNWYESNAAAGDEELRPRGWAGMHWSPAIGAEHLATRERAGLFDESSFAKLEVAGPGAAEFLERLCDNRVAGEVGGITYTQMLNSRGGIECDFTVTRVGEEQFSIVTGTAFGNHDLSWITRHQPADGSVRCSDVTARWACFALWGPAAREILAPLTEDPLEFPYMSMRELTVGDVPARALRVTFVGELGWELYCPTEYGAGLWRTIWEAGRDRGLVAGGYRAIDSMRLEKGYRVWAADITSDETPLEAGLGFCVKRDRSFLGAAALGLGKDGERPALERRLRCLVLEDPRSVALGNEPVRVEGEILGRVTSGGYGYSVERSIAYAYLPAELDIGTAVELDIFGRWVGGEVAREPLFDPRGERVRS